MCDRLGVVLGIALALALPPSTAHAQLETFVREVGALAEAAGHNEPSRTQGVRAAAGRMAAALNEWDRNIAALEARVSRELAGASDQRAHRLHVELGVVYRARGHLSAALREFDAAATLQPSASDLQVLRGLTLDAAGRPEKAGEAFLAAWRLDAHNPVKAYYVARQSGAAGATDRERARAVLAQAYKSMSSEGTRGRTAPFLSPSVIPDNLSGRPAVGDADTAPAFALLAAGRYSDAVASLTRAGNPATQDTNAPLAHFVRGQAYEAQNRIAEARFEYGAAIAGTLTGRSMLRVAMARLAQVEGDLEGAIEAFADAVRLSPNDPNIHRELAGAYAAFGRVDDALCELMAAWLIDRRDGQTHAALGQLHLDTGRSADAVAAFTRALDVMPERHETRYGLATALNRLGRTTEAAQQLALFEQASREMLERRRRGIADEVEREEAVRRGLAAQGSPR